MTGRIAKKRGEWINRDKPLTFEYEGQVVNGYEGDTISSALWAAGIRVLGRSFKYHRARGLLSFANHDVNALMTDGEDTNIRADVWPVSQGMALSAVNTDGGVVKDRNKYIDKLSPFLPVGFYYKTFYKPKSLFPFWEDKIRKAAGLGKVNFNYPRILKPKRYAHCDVLIVGAGASGLSAAVAAAKQGLNVILVDENKQAGGSLTYDFAGDQTTADTLNNLLDEVTSNANIRLITGAYAGGYYTDHLVPIVGVDGITKVRAKTVIVASGVFEQPPVFRYNDLPGVMLGSATQRLINRYAVKPFQKGVVVTANDHGYRTALDMAAVGIEVVAVIDMRRDGAKRDLAEKVTEKGIAVHKGSCIYEVVPASNKMAVKEVVVCHYNEDTAEADPRSAVRLSCDGVAMSAGWAPAAALLYQAGTKMRFDYDVQQFVPDQLPEGVFAAGKVNGVFDLKARLLDGQRAAVEASNYLGNASELITVTNPEMASPSHPYPIVNHPKGKNFVDFDEDIQVKDFINAAKEGFDNIELMKRFTTVGMGPSQGKHSNMNAIRILARIRQLPVEKIGTTTARPFFHPTPIGHLGGRSFHPHRYTAMHQWHVDNGGVMMEAGVWMRPAYYVPAGSHLSASDAVQEEAMAVRQSVGMIDGSTLGKIEVFGQDAAAFLERFYTGKFAGQKVGGSRIAMLLDEAGVMVDDGVAVRMAEDKFYVSTNSSNAATVYREMQRNIQLWGMQVTLVNLTGAMAAMTVAGPASRSVVETLIDIDVSAQGLPDGAYKEGQVAGIDARVMRVSFVSDLAFEIHVPYKAGMHVWQALMAAGKQVGIRAFGTDAQRLLRLEMGHHLVSHDTDGLTNPFEAHSESLVAMDKDFFIGQRSLKIIEKKPLNKKLVTFVLDNGFTGELPKECNLVIENGDIKGRVTSISHSNYLNRIIGFAFVSPEQSKSGSRFQVRTDSGAMVPATVTQAPFFHLLESKGA
ncbi:FAD-dependent oxidoreductase [Methylophaga thiooxydans]|uniref:Glycine cleavage T-protein (Aminomethyl transferase) n=1 Tax=Methylophaga thiooxydans DMS010 TaxID=637616 RepID=C0N1N6_9GAMM|nr:FAD-dependent oxidoreductase [Methylophaga thiooxydans]EEF81183.1 Glycine cleavage T-protein (aminomethyl transferase) [Methylophaga thiooxydans DMS010]